ncbi:MAG TPA: hypothetical protein VGF22_00150, partial [Acidimicrobiales bacterium]
PLELMARRLLLPLVPAPVRRSARKRLLWVAARYEQAGEPVTAREPAGYGSVAASGTALIAGIDAGDLEAVDGAASHFLRYATLDQVMALAEPTIDLVSAAGHAPIGFFLASRLATTSRSAVMLLRPTLRELARAPELRLRWVADAGAADGDEPSLTRALAATPRLGLPGNDFIFPIVHQVDGSGIAPRLLRGAIPADVTAAATATLRVAVLSMLQDDPAFAPYGWTHCLSLPHAIFEIMPWLVDRHRAAAVAATYVVGFRAAEGARLVDPDWVPEPTSTSLIDALEAEPAVAASSWYHASDAALEHAVPELIGRAAVHEDAHVAKYTLACLATAERDRARRPLYLAAAASLAAWWSQRQDTAFRDDL